MTIRQLQAALDQVGVSYEGLGRRKAPYIDLLLEHTGLAAEQEQVAASELEKQRTLEANRDAIGKKLNAANLDAADLSGDGKAELDKIIAEMIGSGIGNKGELQKLLLEAAVNARLQRVYRRRGFDVNQGAGEAH